jgi:hypothetical protein
MNHEFYYYYYYYYYCCCCCRYHHHLLNWHFVIYFLLRRGVDNPLLLFNPQAGGPRFIGGPQFLSNIFTPSLLQRTASPTLTERGSGRRRIGPRGKIL